MAVRHGPLPDEAVYGADTEFSPGVRETGRRFGDQDFLDHGNAERKAGMADAGNLPVPADVKINIKDIFLSIPAQVPSLLLYLLLHLELLKKLPLQSDPFLLLSFLV